ncbi:Potassium-transporting ATPase ATP-binding subunit like [Actinidia chinensis var. chinensis]|uniref:Potassium-transporting ATPase ATP-binding subunit like n=1 Tax=Actinidia chinensis var. chinensis TaxID=1590841 RepID=A0A2R6P577_ACTCC|nr:Potassium-transporting ATPase ATP-binding subunit like [Actinidia chinensis var. chinensis]
MSLPVVSTASIPKTLPPGKSEIKLRRQTNPRKPIFVKFHSVRKISASKILARSVRCGAAGQSQTQTVTRQSSTITVAPQAKEKSPELDDGGSGLPPRDDDDGGGGGGGGGGWGGGFFFFAFLALLGFLKDQEDEGSYQDSRRRSKNY